MVGPVRLRLKSDRRESTVSESKIRYESHRTDGKLLRINLAFYAHFEFEPTHRTYRC